MKYSFISADPPWYYESWNNNEGLPHRRSQMRGLATAVYTNGVMTMDRLLAMGEQVQSVTEKNAALMLWVTGPHLFDALPLATAWGFPHFSTILFAWVKSNPRSGKSDLIDLQEKDLKAGLGYWTMSNVELALLFLRGSKPPKKAATGVKQIIVSPLREHSEKPLEANQRFQTLMGEGNYLDIFARRYTKGFTSLGVELDGLDICESLNKLSKLELPFLPKGVKEPFTAANEIEDWQTQLKPEPLNGQQMRLAF